MSTMTISSLPAECKASGAIRLLAAAKLTKREWEILTLRARNWVIKDIAADLGLAIKTVNSHIRNAMAKLHASGLGSFRNGDLMVLFLRSRIVTVDDLRFSNRPYVSAGSVQQQAYQNGGDQQSEPAVGDAGHALMIGANEGRAQRYKRASPMSELSITKREEGLCH